MTPKNFDLLRGFLVSFLLAWIFTNIPIWQLVIIPGFITGVLSKTLKRASLISGFGIFMAWGLYTLSGVFLTSITVILDQFGALIIGPGYAWLFILIIILIGFVLGILGGAFGFFVKTLINDYRQESTE